jgi:hypothetical protein
MKAKRHGILMIVFLLSMIWLSTILTHSFGECTTTYDYGIMDTTCNSLLNLFNQSLFLSTIVVFVIWTIIVLSRYEVLPNGNITEKRRS